MMHALDPSSGHRRRFARLRAIAPILLVAGLFLLGLYALDHLLAPVNFRQVMDQIEATPRRITGLAMLATFAGYLCLAGYDWSALRYLGKSLPTPLVLTGGMMAYGFGNTIGLTAISGGAVRWRFYAGLGLDGYDIAVISTFTAVAFGVMATVIGLGALALHPTALAAVLPFAAGEVRLVAIGAIAAIMLPLLWMSFSGRCLSVWRLTLRAPDPAVLGAQMLIGIGDITFSSLTLYLLMPDTGLGFFTFLAIFAAASVAGVLSHVPGGVGVFESVILTAMPAGVPLDKAAAALLLFRLIYYILPFALSLIFLSLHEGWRALGGKAPRGPLGRALLAVEPALSALSPLAPLVLAVTIFGSGLWMTVSALLPPVTEAAETAEAIFPLAFVEGSTLLLSALGAGLIVLSLGVVRRSRAAFWLSLGAMVAGIAIALAQVDAEQALTLAVFVALLFPFRRAFYRRSVLTHSAMTPGWALLLLMAAAGFGFALFFTHRSTPYANELWWQFAADARAPRALRAGLMASLVLGLTALAMLLRVPHIRPGPAGAETLAQVAGIVAEADDPDAGFALTGDKAIILSDDGRAFVMFGVSGRSWIAYGGPVGAPDAAEEVAFSFVDAARRAGAEPVFYEIGVETVPQMLDLGMTLHKMGEEAVVDLARFSLDGPERKRLRTTHARAGRDGLVLEITEPPHDPALIAALREVSDQWLASGKTHEKGFSVGRFDPVWLDRWPVAVVRKDGRILAFANILATHTKRRATVDMMRRASDAPPEVMEFLFTALMLALKERGYAEFSLGMAPLSGLSPDRSRKMWDRFGTLIFRHAGRFYNFAGLRAFKDKFDPEWRPHYLATASTHMPLIPLADAARLIAQAPSSRDLTPEAQP